MALKPAIAAAATPGKGAGAGSGGAIVACHAQRVIAANTADKLLEEAGCTARNRRGFIVHFHGHGVFKRLLMVGLISAGLIKGHDDDMLFLHPLGLADPHMGKLRDVNPVALVKGLDEGWWAQQGLDISLL